MYTTLLVAALIAPAQPAAKAPDKHETANELYNRLLETGLPVGEAKVKFPKPTMPDGLNGATQTKIIKALIDGKYDYEEFIRESVVAPQKIVIGEAVAADPKKPIDKDTPGRTVSVWFVAYGDFKKLEDDKFLDQLGGANRGSGGKAVEIKGKDLADRKITIAKENVGRESYGHIEFDFLSKVRLKATGHAMWTRNAESVVAAAEVDPRFLADKQFPNEWRAINNGNVGNPQPWTGAAMYLKVTKLQEPAGAVFIEQHIIFGEPTGWFAGAPNFLTTKLPIAVQDNVRTMRKEFSKKP